MYEMFSWMLCTIIGWINSIIQWCWNRVISVVQLIYDFFFHEANGWVWWFFDYFLGLFEWFIDLFPDMCSYIDGKDYSGSFGTLVSVLGKINDFFPVHESLALLSVFILFVGVFLGVKAILKLVPFVG